MDKRSKGTRKSHIVPKSYLRYFTNSNGRLCRYDNILSKWLDGDASPEAVCFEKDFYYMPHNQDDPLHWETTFANETDTLYGKPYRKLLEKLDTVPDKAICLSRKDKELLLKLIIVQLSRTKKSKEFANNADKEGPFSELHQFMIQNFGQYRRQRRRIEKAFDTARDLFNEQYMFDLALERFDDNNGVIKTETRKFILNRNWNIFETEGNLIYYLTCDEPVILYNPYTEMQGIGNIGIAQPTTYIYYPLSSKYLLLVSPEQQMLFLNGELSPICDGQKYLVNYNFVQRINQLTLRNCSRFIYGRRTVNFPQQ